MSDDVVKALVVVGIAMAVVLAVLVAFRVIRYILGRSLDLLGDASERAAKKAKSVAAKAGHSMAAIALRARAENMVAKALEVSDQQTGANELSLDPEQTKRNRALASKIVERGSDNMRSRIDREFPSPIVLGTYALLFVAVQVNEPVMKEKTRIAGEALSSLMKDEMQRRGQSNLNATERILIREVESFIAKLLTDSIADAIANA